MSAPDSPRLAELVNAVVHGDRIALAELFTLHRDRLWRIVHFRLDRRLYGRVDVDDVLQEVFINAEKRLDHLLEDSPDAVFIWFRLLTNQTLIDLHRRHLGAQARDARRERRIDAGWSPESTSLALSFHLLGHLTSPSQAAARAELSQQLELAISSMSDIDREVLALRHFEELTNSEAARILDITEQAASLRYVRALARLKRILEAIPGLVDG